MNQIRTVLFDLDGTLLDTAQDIAYVLNLVRKNHGLPEVPFTRIRPCTGKGLAALLKLGLDLDEKHPHFTDYLEECFTLYAKHATTATRLFPGMETVLDYLDTQRIQWGIVTNKPSRFTFDILKNLDLECRAACIVCGDTVAKHKPDPEPILHACHLLQRTAQDCVYIGDAHIDIMAGKSAGAETLVALYGYIDEQDNPFSWQADGYIREPKEIIDWLSKPKST